MFHRQQHGAAPLPPDSEALRESKHDQQDRRPDADPIVAGDQADQGGRDAHEHQRPNQHRLPADPVAVVPKYNPAQRPRDEADRKGAVGAQGAGQRVEPRKEQPVEDQRRGGAVQEEVVPLNGGADEAREDDLAELIWFGHGRWSEPFVGIQDDH